MIQHRCRYCGAWEFPNAPVEGVYTTDWVCDECASILAAIIAERKAAIGGNDCEKCNHPKSPLCKYCPSDAGADPADKEATQ